MSKPFSRHEVRAQKIAMLRALAIEIGEDVVVCDKGVDHLGNRLVGKNSFARMQAAAIDARAAAGPAGPALKRAVVDVVYRADGAKFTFGGVGLCDADIAGIAAGIGLAMSASCPACGSRRACKPGSDGCPA